MCTSPKQNSHHSRMYDEPRLCEEGIIEFTSYELSCNKYPNDSYIEPLHNEINNNIDMTWGQFVDYLARKDIALCRIMLEQTYYKKLYRSKRKAYLKIAREKNLI